MSKKIDQATEALDVATKAHDEAQAAYRAARAAYDAQRTDEQWCAVEEAQRAVVRRAADKTAAEKALAAAKAEEAAQAAERARAAKLERLEAIREIETRRTPARHVAAIIRAEKALAAALAAAWANEAESIALHREASELAAALGTVAGLPRVRTFAQVRALISVDADRADATFIVADTTAAVRTPTQSVLLPRMPTEPRERARGLADLLGEQILVGDEYDRLWPDEARVKALLDGSYRAERASLTKAVQAADATRRAEIDARRAQEDREYAERQASVYPPFRQII